EGVRDSATNGAAGTRDYRNLTGEGQSLALAQFGQFEWPVFDVKRVGFRNRFERPDFLRAADAFDCGFGNVSGYARVLGACAEPNSPRPGTNTTRGRGSCISVPLARAFWRLK